MYYLDDEKNNSDDLSTESVEPSSNKIEGSNVGEDAGNASNASSEEYDPTKITAQGGDVDSAKDQSPDTYSSVSLAANRRKFIVIGVIAAAVAVLYFVYNSTNQAVNRDSGPLPKISQDQVDKAISTSKPVTQDINTGVGSKGLEIPRAQLPDLSQLQEPEPPAPPPPPEPLIPQTPILGGQGGGPQTPTFGGGSSGAIFESRSQQEREALLAKRGENIMVIGGNSSTGFGNEQGEEGDATKEKKDNNGFLGFGDGQLDGDTFNKTSSEQVKATKIGNLNRLVAQGKMISAVLETAINTDIPGTLRAIVARDVYAESGKRVLIPKGSRLIGEYESDVKNGQVRVPIMWNRVLLPNGFDVDLNSPGTDRLGRAGINGKLDNKFWTRMGSAFLVSLVIPYASFNLSKVKKTTSTNSTSTATDGTITTSRTGDVEAQLIADGSKKFSDIATEIVKSSFSEKPTITVNQGEIIKIFVSKDIIFPTEEYMNRQRFR